MTIIGDKNCVHCLLIGECFLKFCSGVKQGAADTGHLLKKIKLCVTVVFQLCNIERRIRIKNGKGFMQCNVNFSAFFF